MKSLDQLKAALENSEFFLEFMPIHDLVDNPYVGAETLVHWKHHNKIIPPDEFIPVIENTPLAGLLTYWIVEELGRELGGSYKLLDYPQIFNIEHDPREEHNVSAQNAWGMPHVMKFVGQYKASLKAHPNPPASNLSDY